MTTSQGFGLGLLVGAVGGVFYMAVRTAEQIQRADSLTVEANQKLTKSELYFGFVQWFVDNIDDMNEDAFYAYMRERLKFTETVTS